MQFCCVEVNQCTLKLRQIAFKNFVEAAIFLVLIFPTGVYTQIKCAGTFVDDFLDPLSTESNPGRLSAASAAIGRIAVSY